MNSEGQKCKCHAVSRLGVAAELGRSAPNIETMNAVERFPIPYLALLVLAFLGAGLATLLLRIFVAVIVRLFFRIPISAEELQQQIELEEKYSEEIDRISVWENVLMIVLGVATPFLFLRIARWLILRDVTSPNVLMHTGALMLIIPLCIAGALLGSLITAAFIQARFSYPHSEALLELYRRSEDRKYGYLGRIILTKAATIFAFIIVVASIFLGNRYTVVTNDSIDIPTGFMATERLVIPNTIVTRLVELRRVSQSGRGPGPEYLIFLRGGRILSSSSSVMNTGELADMFNSAKEAINLVSSATRVPIERISLKPGEEFSRK